MLSQSVRLCLTFGATAVFLRVMIVPRLSRKLTDGLIIGLLAVLLAVNIPLQNGVGHDRFLLVVPFSSLLPTILLSSYVSANRGLKYLFSIFTVIAFGIVGASLGMIALIWSRSVFWDILTRAVFFSLMYLYAKTRFLAPFHDMLRYMDHGWLLLCMLPLSFYAMFVLLTTYPVTIYDRPENLPALLFTSIIVLVSYGFITLFFTTYRSRFEARREGKLLEAHLNALRRQIELVRESEEQVRIQRHDMRHYTRMLHSLLREGKAEAAIEVLMGLDDELEAAYQKYCENLTVNAMLSLYLDKARREKIAVETWLDIPDQLPVDAIELSTMLANAIENAIQASLKLPEEKRSLQLICISRPQFVMEISNAYAGGVTLDKEGIPLASAEGHGIGTRSIQAFARDNGALIEYRIDENTFRLRVLIPRKNPSGKEAR